MKKEKDNIPTNEQPEVVNEEVSYRFDETIRKMIVNAISHYPYNKVKPLVIQMNKPSLNVEEVNAVINSLAKFPYVEIADIMDNIGSYIIKN